MNINLIATSFERIVLAANCIHIAAQGDPNGVIPGIGQGRNRSPGRISCVKVEYPMFRKIGIIVVVWGANRAAKKVEFAPHKRCTTAATRCRQVRPGTPTIQNGVVFPNLVGAGTRIIAKIAANEPHGRAINCDTGMGNRVGHWRFQLPRVGRWAVDLGLVESINIAIEAAKHIQVIANGNPVRLEARKWR